MKNKTLSTIQSLVFVTLFTCALSFTAHADGTGNGLVIGQPDPCASAASDFQSNYSKMQASCKSTGDDKSCFGDILTCVQNNDQEDTDDSDDDGMTGQCYAFSYQNYKSDQKDLESQLKDSKKDLRDLQKQKTDATKSYNDDKSKLTKDFQEASDDYNKQTMQDKDDQRKQATDQKSQQDSLNKQIRDLQMQILQAQNQQALMTSQRATSIDDYKMKLLQCKADTQKYQQQVANHTLNGLASLSVKGGGATNDVNTYWQTCVNKVLKTRDDDANKYSVAMTQLSAQVTQLQQSLNDSQQSLQLMASQAQQQANDNQTKSQQQFQSFQQKQKNVAQQMQDLNTNFQQQSTALAQQIMEAQQDNNTNSNALKKFKGQSPPKASDSMADGYKAAVAARTSCMTSSDSAGNKCPFTKSPPCLQLISAFGPKASRSSGGTSGVDGAQKSP